uniref:F-box domain-containing protein n=1 Tax=Lactuca sativa TaxID=4236 RepID=A0A9R1V430_LACSA|nr:hypothetical protein LSAT_V11C700352440 [Lactuca sativa]
MEMAEEVPNQPKISPNWNKCQEIVENGDMDRINLLPNCLLHEILSCLPSTKDAIRTALRHVKELTIGVFCFKVMSYLKAKGFVSPSNIKFPPDTSYEWLVHGI